LPDRQPRLRRFVMNRSKTRCPFVRLFPARRNADRRSARHRSLQLRGTATAEDLEQAAGLFDLLMSPSPQLVIDP
jgi:hypothetical protein